MKKTLALFFVLPLFALGCQGATTQDVGTTDVQQTIEATDTTTPETKHYDDGSLSFDYPGDLFVFRTTQGEGSWSEELTFLEEDKDGIYNYAGPVLSISSWGEDSSTKKDLSAEEKYKQDLKEVGDGVQMVTLATSQAFAVPVIDDFGGQNYTRLEFLFENPRYDSSLGYGTPYFYGVIARPFAAPNVRYQEILDMFKKTVRFN